VFPLLPSLPIVFGLLTLLLNNSFAYVDFAKLDAKKVAITMSESHLDGRRLLIKDGAYASSGFCVSCTTLLMPGPRR
jgi:hypothetical protein